MTRPEDDSVSIKLNDCFNLANDVFPQCIAKHSIRRYCWVLAVTHYNSLGQHPHPQPFSRQREKGVEPATIKNANNQLFLNMENFPQHQPIKLPDDIRVWARELRASMTDAEILLWKILRNRRLTHAKFRRQHPVGRYILDFYCHEKKLAIELDGSQHADAADYDIRRDVWLRTQGIQVYRFWNNQVLSETEAVMEMIYVALHSAPSPP